MEAHLAHQGHLAAHQQVKRNRFAPPSRRPHKKVPVKATNMKERTYRFLLLNPSDVPRDGMVYCQWRERSPHRASRKIRKRINRLLGRPGGAEVPMKLVQVS